ncbi:MAG: hypothetical protein E7653_05200 [Ruminococcaceae bacterium]|nr:hypothetical protein [Oscillospiraceae bacterium]
MKEYILTLFCVCCVAAVIRTACPENATKKYIEMLCAVCVISAISLPIFGAFADFDGFDSVFVESGESDDNYDEIYKSYLNDKGVDSAESVISDTLCEQLGVDGGAIRIVLHIDEESSKVLSATAIIGNGAVDTDPALISSHIKNTLGVECDIVYELFDE